MHGSKTRSGLNAITDPAVYKRVAELFSQAAELPVQDQAAFLRDRCGSDTDLLRLVENLLQEDREGPIEPELAADRSAPAIHEDLSGRTLSHYQIIRPMGAGGMGVVYRAMDTRLQRTVALKFLPAFLRDDSASRERFIREARVVASIDHQNVCPVYEIEEADGFIFIAMACLEGASLEAKIRTGPIPVEQAIGTALQAAHGLQAAHAKGVVHRDIKPANLMLINRESAEPLVRILDFGIAQWTEKTVLTQEGLRIGTVLYMAPEQVAGSRVDRRADIWSLGVVLYQMLSGRAPFEGSTLRETLAAIAGPQAANLMPIREVASPEVVSIVRKMLEKEPGKRYQTVSPLILDLESVPHTASPGLIARLARGPALHRAAGSIAIGGLVGLSIFLLARYNRPHEEDAKIRSLAVLPFDNLTRDPGQEYLADGMTDEITTDLAKIRSLKVISRSSTQRYRRPTEPLAQIGRQLNVDALVEGTVLLAGNRVRVTAQLIRTATDAHVWADSYERNPDDIFAVQREIAENIAREIGATLVPAMNQRATRGPPTAEAYDLYLRGRYLWNKRTLHALKKSISYYERVIAADPDYAKAYAALGESYVVLSSYGGPEPAESFRRAREAAQHALQLDSSLGQAHTVLGAVHVSYDWDWQNAAAEYRRAIELDPNDPTAHHWYGLLLSCLRMYGDAEAEIQKATVLDPLSLIIITDAGDIYYRAREPDEALLRLGKVLELDPNFAEAHLVLGKVYELKKDWQHALAEFELGVKLFGGSPNVVALKAHALAASGRRDEALAIARHLQVTSSRRYVSDVDLALIDCALGQRSRAVMLLERAYQQHGKGLDLIGADPLFDGCRPDPGFQTLLVRLRLAQ